MIHYPFLLFIFRGEDQKPRPKHKAAILLRGADSHDDQGVRGEAADAQRHLRVYSEQVPVLREKQKGLAEQYPP